MPTHDFEAKLSSLWPPLDWTDLTVLVAVSGGADSVALLRGLQALCSCAESNILLPQGKLVVAHVNHRLRGEESERDAAFVRGLAAQLHLACEVIIADERLQSDHGDGIEAAARNARYKVLEEAAGRHGARYIVAAHTADDQAETVLHRITRGTGLRGLAGMARARRLGCATLLRPLLTVRRAELVAYLSALGQPYRFDSSNDSLDFTRNRIRRQVIPLVEESINPAFKDALRRLATLAGEAQSVIDEQVEILLERCIVFQSASQVSISIAGLGEVNRHVVREMFALLWRRQDWPLQAMGFDEWELLAAMAIDGKRAAATLPGALIVSVNEGMLVLQR